MAVQEIITSSGSIDPVKGSKAQPQEKPPPRAKTAGEVEEKSDRVEVSEQARALYEAEQSNRLETIREKIREGLYLDEQVTEKIVDALVKELQTPPVGE